MKARLADGKETKKSWTDDFEEMIASALKAYFGKGTKLAIKIEDRKNPRVTIDFDNIPGIITIDEDGDAVGMKTIEQIRAKMKAEQDAVLAKMETKLKKQLTVKIKNHLKTPGAYNALVKQGIPTQTLANFSNGKQLRLKTLERIAEAIKEAS